MLYIYSDHYVVSNTMIVNIVIRNVADTEDSSDIVYGSNMGEVLGRIGDIGAHGRSTGTDGRLLRLIGRVLWLIGNVLQIESAMADVRSTVSQKRVLGSWGGGGGGGQCYSRWGKY